MSFVQPTTIQIIADSVNVPPCSNEAAKALAPHVDVRLREIIQEAAKFMRHSKRDTLTTEDINRALRLRNVEPVFGIGGSKDPARYVRAAGHPDLFYVEDPIRGLEEVIAAPLPAPPWEVSVMPHWLAIEGVQPRIPENSRTERGSVDRRPSKRQRIGAAGPGPSAKPPGMPESTRGALAAGGAAVPVQAPQAAATDAQGRPADILPPLRHRVSQELQEYYRRTQHLLFPAEQPAAGAADADAGRPGGEPGGVGGPTPAVAAVLESLATDPGLQELLPYMVRDLTLGIRQAIEKGGPKLHSALPLMLKAMRALVANEDLDLGPYLDKVLPSTMTVAVAARLGVDTSRWHWAIRDQAASLLGFICSRYGSVHEGISTRAAKTLVKAFQVDPKIKGLQCHYGCIRGIQALGPRAVRLYLLPNMRPYMDWLADTHVDPKDLNNRKGDTSWQKQQDATMVRGAMLQAVGGCLHHLLSQRDGEHCLLVGGRGQKPPKINFNTGVPLNGGSWVHSLGYRQAGLGPHNRLEHASRTGQKREKLLLLPGPSGPETCSHVHDTVNNGRDAPAEGHHGGVKGEHGADVPSGSNNDGAPSSKTPAGPPLQNGMIKAAQPGANRDRRTSETKETSAPILRNQRSLSGSGGSGKRTKASVSGNNPLANAWREDFDPGKIVMEALDMFGDEILPWLPAEHLSQITI